MKSVLRKAKKIADEWCGILIMVLPISWVIACLNGATEYLASGDFMRFVCNVFAACIVSFILLGFGLYFSGLNISADESSRLPLGRWKALGIELLILLVITFYLHSKK